MRLIDDEECIPSQRISEIFSSKCVQKPALQTPNVGIILSLSSGKSMAGIPIIMYRLNMYIKIDPMATETDCLARKQGPLKQRASLFLLPQIDTVGTHRYRGPAELAVRPK